MEESPKPKIEKNESEQTNSADITVPPQYEGMHPDAVEIAWVVPTYVDPDKTLAEQERRAQVLQHLRRQEAVLTTDETNQENKTSATESSGETEVSLERFLEQPNVQAAQKGLEELLQSDSSLNTEEVKRLLYDLLTKRSWLHEELTKRGSKELTWMVEEYKPHREWYRSALDQMESQFSQAGIETASNPAWFSMTASERTAEQGERSRYKVYDTLALNDYTKITALPQLLEKLKTIGEETQESIKLKIPGGFNGFITHNDSIVIHCDSADTCKRAQHAIDEWKAEQGFASAERELDRATIALDGKTEASGGENESFSQLVAAQMTAWIEEHKDNYPADTIASEAIKHTISLAQKTPTTA